MSEEAQCSPRPPRKNEENIWQTGKWLDFKLTACKTVLLTFWRVNRKQPKIPLRSELSQDVRRRPGGCFTLHQGQKVLKEKKRDVAGFLQPTPETVPMSELRALITNIILSSHSFLINNFQTKQKIRKNDRDGGRNASVQTRPTERPTHLFPV